MLVPFPLIDIDNTGGIDKCYFQTPESDEHCWTIESERIYYEW